MAPPAASSSAPVMPLPAGTTGSGPRRDAMSDGQNEQAQPFTTTVLWAEETAVIPKPTAVAFEKSFAFTLVTWVTWVAWLRGPNAMADSASRSGRTSPSSASSSCMLSSDIMLPFFFLLDFRYPRLAGTGGFARADLRSGAHVPNQAGNLA